MSIRTTTDGSNVKGTDMYLNPKDLKQFGRSTVVSHEMNHIKDNDVLGVFPRNLDIRSTGVNDLMKPISEIVDKQRGVHDAYGHEFRSDINAARYLMFDKGLFDPINESFTPDKLKLLKEDKEFKNNDLIKRLLENAKDDNSLIEGFNTISQIQTKEKTRSAATGGSINPMRRRLRYGGPTNPPYTLVVTDPKLTMPTPTTQIVPAPAVTYNNPIPKYKKEGTSSKSKSKDRFREHATGGGIDPISIGLTAASTLVGGIAGSLNYKPTEGPETKGLFQRSLQAIAQNPIGGPLSIIPEVIKFNKERNTVVSGSPGSYAKGGSVKRCATGGEMDEDANPNDTDDQLSSNAFQVKGNPNVTDGNTYNINGSPVKLDHNEVIDTQRNFVFSDDLKIGKKSFADMAVKPNKAIGKAEKILQSNPYDEQAKKTIEFSNRNLGTIATIQEEMATLMGLRKEEPQALAAGGYYQDPVKKIYNPFDPYSDPFNPYSPGLNIPANTAQPAPYQASGNPVRKSTSRKQVTNPAQTGPYNPGYVDPQMDVYVNQNTTKYSPVQEMNPLNMLQRSSTSYPTNNFTNPDGEVVNIGELGKPVTTSNPIQVTSERAAPSPSVSNVLGSNATTSNTTDSNTNGMTMGDYLQFAEVGSKFFQTLRGPEVENQILDNTRITKNNYDVRPQLLQSQRSFQNQSNSIDSPSLNLRRSLTNNLYASKLNADAGVISQYDNMNKQANSQYEQQVSGQRRYNIQSTQYTNNLNAANRGAYDSTVQNAYTSLGNLGESLNNRKRGQDALKILSQRYPDVYKGVVEELFNKKKS